MIKLVNPSLRHAESFTQACEETNTDCGDIEMYIQHVYDAARNKNLIHSEVARREYWLINGNRYIGKIQIRYKPKGRFSEIKSHIYYEVRPSERNKGYGTQLLKLAIPKAREMGITKLIIAVDESNVDSKGIIENNAGKYTKKVKTPDAETSTLLYEIDL